jgi:cardiolipin synthase
VKIPTLSLLLPGILLILGLSSCAGSPSRGVRQTIPSNDLGNAFLEYYESYGIKAVKASRPKLYFSSDEWHDRALDLIENAKDYILISSFLINSHEVNKDILSALERKAREHVRVYVMYDSSSYFTYMPDKTSYLPTPIAEFEGTGVKVAEYNPMSGAKAFAIPSLLDRDHRKFWIVDGTYFATGGRNLNYYSFAPKGPFHNIDTFVELEGSQVLKPMIESFCVTWNRYSPERIDPDSFSIQTSKQDKRDEDRVWILDHDPGIDSMMNVLFDSFFLSARKEIWMIQAYAFPTRELIQKISKATKRGVSVKIVLSDNSFRPAYDKAARYRILDLLAVGAEVFMFDAPDKSFLHYKLLLADRTVAAFGSPNYNFRTQYLSKEIAVVSANPQVGAETFKNLESLLKHVRPVTMEEAAGYRGLDYFSAWFSMLLGG